jgi:SAM-dependent methyltransferase
MSEFDSYASNYNAALNQGLKLTGEPKEFFASQRISWLKQRLHGESPCVRGALDFGCGTGTSCSYLLQGFGLSHYLGYDPSASSIDQARAGSTDSTARFEYDPESLPQAFFDLAFTNGVFHHIPPDQRAEAAALVWKALKPGGYFAFWENNRWNPVVHFMMSRVPFDRDAQMLFPHQARSLLKTAGFEIVLTDYLFVFPAALKMLRPLEPALCKLPLGGQYLVLARKPLSISSPTPSPT